MPVARGEAPSHHRVVAGGDELAVVVAGAGEDRGGSRLHIVTGDFGLRSLVFNSGGRRGNRGYLRRNRTGGGTAEEREREQQFGLHHAPHYVGLDSADR